MASFHIEGKQIFKGELPVRGAKNHALKLLAAALLSDGETVITNLPFIEDVTRMIEILTAIGCRVQQNNRSVRIIAPSTFHGQLPKDLVPQLRASLVLLGPLLTRYGYVTLPHPGGDNIGKRPINFFLDGLRAMGAVVTIEPEQYIFHAPKGLHGAHIVFPNMSVTGTETLMMAAIGAQGTTTLINAACEPEVTALAKYLCSVGAQILGAGTSRITIIGGSLTHGGSVEVIPDRIEAGSFIVLAAATKSHIVISHCNTHDLDVPLALCEEIGVTMNVKSDTIEILPSRDPYHPIDIVTHEYPGFPTDLQAPFTVLLTQANGESTVRETIYEARLFYTDLLNAMGARITMLDPYRIQIYGPTSLYGTLVEGPDIRAGIAIMIAAFIADGKTEIQHIYHIDRGYERIEERLQHIGARITRTNAQ